MSKAGNKMSKQSKQKHCIFSIPGLAAKTAARAYCRAVKTLFAAALFALLMGIEIPVYADIDTAQNIPAINVVSVRKDLHSMQKRMGDLRKMDSEEKHDSLWARPFLNETTIKEYIDTDISFAGLEAGYDWIMREDNPARVYGGLMFGFMDISSVETDKINGQYEDGSGTAPSFGIYLSAVGDEDWFADFTLRNYWAKMDMATHISDTEKHNYSFSREILAASLESGMDYAYYFSGFHFLRFSPKAELTYIHAAADQINIEGTSDKLNFYGANYANAKAAVFLSLNLANKAKGFLLEPYAEAAFRYDFLAKDKVSSGHYSYSCDLTGVFGEFAAGINAQFSKKSYIYLAWTYETGQKISGHGISAGLRYSFNAKNVKSKLTIYDEEGYEDNGEEPAIQVEDEKTDKPGEPKNSAASPAVSVSDSNEKATPKTEQPKTEKPSAQPPAETYSPVMIE